jgi:predicted transposase/invertase (TIGR01784 family)
MKTDKIFYQLFQFFPSLLFELLGQNPELGDNYEFKSVEVKELSFRLDGVFVPKDETSTNPIYFVEVQFQIDDDFYWRLVTESLLYLRQYKPQRQWQALAIWASRTIEAEIPLAYQSIVDNQVVRIYLDELEGINQDSMGLEIIHFIVMPSLQAREKVQLLVEKTKQEFKEPSAQKAILELIEKIIIYKFPKLSYQELEKMFTLTEWENTQFYKDVAQKTKLETKLEIVPRLRQKGLSISEIAQMLELDEDLIRETIKNSPEQNGT